MDIRLLVDGAASPQAPPGRTAESPPLIEEFKKTLQSARKEDTPGEVADKEPNAQLQKLDPARQETEAAKKEPGAKAPVDPTAISIKFDPAILAQLQQVVFAQLAVPVQLDPTTAPLVKTVVPVTAIDLKGADKIAKAVVAPQGQNALPNLDATSNETISAMVASAFANNTGAAVKANAKGNDTPNLPTAAQSKSTDRPTVQQALGSVATVKETSDAQAKLNITSVLTSSSSISSQLDAGSAAVKVQPLANAVVPTGKSAPLTDFKSIAVEKDAVSVVSVEVSQGNSEETSSKDKESDSQSSNPQIQTPVQTSEIAQPASATTNHQLTATERQVMVENISKKIDELAAKSVRNEVRVEMHPPELGSVVINIRKDMAGLTATLNASNEPLRQALHESRNDLAGALADRNVGQVKIEVRGASADTMSMGQQFSQAQSQQHNQQNQSKQATLPTGRLIAEEKPAIDQPAPKRVSTALLDMEI